MIEIRISNTSPLSALGELVALAAYQLGNDEVRASADKLLDADKRPGEKGFPVEQSLPKHQTPAQAPAATGSVPPPPPVPPVTASQRPAAPMMPTPVMPAPPAAQPAIPVTAAPQYTYEQLQLAGQYLLDAGKLPELQGLLQKYGISRLPELPREKYGAYATDLRALGARI